MVAINRRLYEQRDYDCQRCGAPEDAALRHPCPVCDGMYGHKFNCTLNK